jgi:small multidrug resistance pump
MISAFIVLIGYNLLYYLILKNGLKLGIAHSLQHSCGIILVFLLGYFIFNQKINFKQIIGVLFLLIGMVLISYYDKN